MSFLPVQDPLEGRSLDSPSDAGDSSVGGELDGLSSIGEESFQARTSSWVLSDSDHNADGDTVAEELVSLLSDDASRSGEVDKMDNEHVIPDLPDSHADAVPTPASSPVDSHETQTVPVIDSDMPQTSGNQHDSSRSDLPRHDSDPVTVRLQ